MQCSFHSFQPDPKWDSATEREPRAPIAESSTMSSANPPSSEQPDATPAQVSASADDAAAGDGASGDPAGFDAVAAAAELDEFLADASAAGAGEAASAEYVAELEADVEALNALVEKKDARIQALEDESEVVRGRLEREADKQLELRTRKLLTGFLDVLDDLERALTSAREVDHNPDVVAGVELVHKRFLAKLGEFGVTHVPALGCAFDPEQHEAMAAVPSTDPEQVGKIIGVMREGYAIGDELLRPAGVAVGQAAK